MLRKLNMFKCLVTAKENVRSELAILKIVVGLTLPLVAVAVTHESVLTPPYPGKAI